MKFSISTLFLLLSFCLVSNLANAADITFNGEGDGTTWQDPDNWDLDRVPTFEDNVFIFLDFEVVILPGTVQAFRLQVSNGVTLTISQNAVLSFTSITDGDEALNVTGGADLINNGTIHIAGSSDNPIRTQGGADLINNGSIFIYGSEVEGIYMTGGSEIINNGNLNISNTGGDGIDMEDGTSFFNFGSLNINTVETEGIDMDDSSFFENRGNIFITGVDDNDGLDQDDDESVFDNYGSIEIVDVTNDGEGLEVDDGIFTNHEGGLITLVAITGDAIHPESDGVIENYGTINVESAAEDSDDAVIEVNENAAFRNYSVVNITAITNVGQDALKPQEENAIIYNDACGVINILADLPINVEDAAASITNDGVIATIFDGTNANEGTFTNNSTITAPSGFAIAPNALAGAGVIDMNGAVPAQSACNINIGGIGCDGETTVDQATQTWTQTSDMCLYELPYTSDNISFAFQEMCGDGQITARVASVTTLGWGGVTIRESMDAGSKKVQLMANQSEVLRREIRTVTNGAATPINIPFYGHDWLRLVRQGNFIRGYVSQNGVNWMFFFNQYLPMDECVQVGLVSTNYNINTAATIVFDNVSFEPGVFGLEEEVESPSLDILNNATADISANIYPNPTNGLVNVELESVEEIVDLRVFNAVGQLIQAVRVDPSFGATQTIDLSNDGPGMYFFHIIGEDGSKRIERVIKK